MVLASLTGSVLGNLLLVGGLSFFVEVLNTKDKVLMYMMQGIIQLLLIFAVVVAFVIPEIFSMKMDAGKTYQLSIGVSIIMIIMYLV